MSEGPPQHRFVDRTKSPYTDETQKDLERHGFFFVANKPVDASIGELFDTSDSPFAQEYRNTLADLIENCEPLSKAPPSKDAPLDLRTFILMWLKAGYEIRFVGSARQKSVDLFARFDLDRFLFRGETEENKRRIPPEALLIEQGYQKDITLPLHHWGDYDAPHISSKRRRYTIDAREIETHIRTLIAKNNDVRLTETRQGEISNFTVYYRPRMPAEHSATGSEPRLSIITTEHPDLLKAQGFHFEDNFFDDGSIEDKKADNKGSVFRKFTLAYWAAAHDLLTIGLPLHEISPIIDTLKNHILHFRRMGGDVRLIRGEYDNRTHEIDEKRGAFYALFNRFDLGLFFEPPHVSSGELLKKGYTFDKNFPFLAWGDALATLPRIPENAASENAEIEKHIKIALSTATGVQVRLLRGAYDTTKKDMDPTQKSVACFTR